MAENLASNLPSSLLPLALDRRRLRGRRHAASSTGITATLEHGSRTVILGANGAGKSVLLRLCHGLLQPTVRRACAGTRRRVPARRAGRRWCSSARCCSAQRARQLTFALRLAGVPRAERGERALRRARPRRPRGARRPPGARALRRRAAAPRARPRVVAAARGAVPRRADRQPRPRRHARDRGGRSQRSTRPAPRS